MSEATKIQWTDHTASPWHGCSKTDNPGCDNCYAAAMAPRNPGTLGIWGDDGVRVKSKSFVNNMRLWQKQAAKAGRTVTVFPSICDPFEDRPELIPWRREMFAVSSECPKVTLLLLTKRPENVLRVWEMDFKCPADRAIWHRPNVWLGTSVSDQATADRNIPELLKCRDLAAKLFVSYEPALGPVDFCNLHRADGWNVDALNGWWTTDSQVGPDCWEQGQCEQGPAIDWVIVGGESGPSARPCNVEWIRSAVKQCEAAGVACFVKQLGASPVERRQIVLEEGQSLDDIIPVKLRSKKGGDPSEWLEDLRVRQFPNT